MRYHEGRGHDQFSRRGEGSSYRMRESSITKHKAIQKRKRNEQTQHSDIASVWNTLEDHCINEKSKLSMSREASPAIAFPANRDTGSYVLQNVCFSLGAVPFEHCNTLDFAINQMEGSKQNSLRLGNCQKNLSTPTTQLIRLL